MTRRRSRFYVSSGAVALSITISASRRAPHSALRVRRSGPRLVHRAAARSATVSSYANPTDTPAHVAAFAEALATFRAWCIDHFRKSEPTAASDEVGT